MGSLIDYFSFFIAHQKCQCPEENVAQLHSILSEQVVYDEIAILNTRLQTDCQVRFFSVTNFKFCHMTSDCNKLLMSLIFSPFLCRAC